jgi:hypothetical protein
MLSAHLIKLFADRTELPIDLDEVTKVLIEGGHQDEINFIPVDINTGVIRGFLKRYRRPKGGWDPNPEDVSDIYYDQNQSSEWINLVCAKELLHILDAACCSTKEQFEKLTESLALPTDMKHLLRDPDFAIVDKLGSAHAAALLLPKAARDLLMPAYQSGVLTDANIAEMAVMPTQHVRSVMGPNWDDIYEFIMAPTQSTPSEPELDF